jgi:site-specific DNA recombinase
VPSIIDEPTFALSQERLEANKTHAPRRTVVSSVVQGLVSVPIAATRSTGHRRGQARAQSITIVVSVPMRGAGSADRFCHSRPIRQDLLDAVVWAEIIKLLEDPSLIQRELDRRLRS